MYEVSYVFNYRDIITKIKKMSEHVGEFFKNSSRIRLTQGNFSPELKAEK